jgi:hypothetical protein
MAGTCLCSSWICTNSIQTYQTQILFYANAGQQKEGSEGGFISLFLSCEVCTIAMISDWSLIFDSLP